MIACKHNLILESIRPVDLRDSDEEWLAAVVARRSLSGMKTCALDVADGGAVTLEEIAEIIGVTKERVRQIEAKAMAKARRFVPSVIRRGAMDVLQALGQQRGDQWEYAPQPPTGIGGVREALDRFMVKVGIANEGGTSATKSRKRGGNSKHTRVPVKDLTGRRYGKLVITGFDKRMGGRAFWGAKCDCGGTRVVDGKGLRQGSIKHCGCEVSKPKRRTRKSLWA